MYILDFEYYLVANDDYYLSRRSLLQFLLSALRCTCQDESNFTLDTPAILAKQRTFTFADAFGFRRNA